MLAVEVIVESDVASDDAASDAERAGNLAGLNWAQYFQQWLTHMAPTHSPIGAYELAERLTNDDGIQRLNADYRQQDRPTDVLAFAALESDLPGAAVLHREQPVYLGDIIISLDTAQRQASEAGHSLETELLWLATHGLLHLLGWDHPDEESLNQMLSQQADLIELMAKSADGA